MIPAGARIVPRCCAAGSRAPTSARSRPDHERFRLETFAPISGGAPRIGPAERRLEAAREAGYRDGYLAGQAEATEAFVAEEARLTSELVEAIADARLTNEAARRHVAATLAPMVEALASAIAPALADAGLGAEIAAS